MDIIWILHSIVSEMKITIDSTLPSESTHVWNFWACVVKRVKWLWWKWWKRWNQQVYKKKDSQHILFPFNTVAAERGTPILPFCPQQHAPSVFAMQIWVFEWPWEEQGGIDWLDMYGFCIMYLGIDSLIDHHLTSWSLRKERECATWEERERSHPFSW